MKISESCEFTGFSIHQNRKVKALATASSVFLGNGAGGFSPATNFSGSSGSISVTTGDFNGDGKLDIATANRNSNNVSVLLGNGIGGFSAATNFSVGTNPESITTGDFNGDDRLDLVHKQERLLDSGKFCRINKCEKNLFLSEKSPARKNAG